VKSKLIVTFSLLMLSSGAFASWAAICAKGQFEEVAKYSCCPRNGGWVTGPPYVDGGCPNGDPMGGSCANDRDSDCKSRGGDNVMYINFDQTRKNH
jgi:hypothetical protein